MEPKSYEELTVFLKNLKIPHDKAWKAIKNQLLPFDKRTRWKIERFRMYAKLSFREIIPIIHKLEKKKVKCKTLKDYKKKFPTRVERLRRVVEMPEYSRILKKYYPNENLNTEAKKRKEVDNLEKLIASKKQDFWFHPAILSDDSNAWKSPAALRMYNLIR